MDKLKINFGSKHLGDQDPASNDLPQAGPEQASIEVIKQALQALDKGDIETAKGLLQQLLQGEQTEAAPPEPDFKSQAQELFKKHMM